MRSTTVDSDGNVRCPNCGAVNSFTSKRTGKAKLFGIVTVGVGAVAMPKRLKCNGCGANLKRGQNIEARLDAQTARMQARLEAQKAREPHPKSIRARLDRRKAEKLAAARSEER